MAGFPQARLARVLFTFSFLGQPYALFENFYVIILAWDISPFYQVNGDSFWIYHFFRLLLVSKIKVIFIDFILCVSFDYEADESGAMMFIASVAARMTFLSSDLLWLR